MDLSIAIVNYKTYEYTKNSIKSALESLDYSDLDGEIILVDNASNDGSLEKLKEDFKEDPRVKFIKNDQNEGFSKANNKALKAAKGDYLLLLNSDTVVNKDTLGKSLNYLKTDPSYGALGCKVLLGDGKLDKACKRNFARPMNSLYHFLKLDSFFPKSKIFGNYNMTYADEDEIQEVECLTGAFMMFPRETYNKIGGLDEDYFMYCEDNDYCYRIHEAGLKNIYFPETEITHFKKTSWNAQKNPDILDSHYNSMLIFYDKHYKDEYSQLTGFLVKLGVNTFRTIDHLKNKLKPKR